MRPTDFTFLVSTAGLHEERHEDLGPVDFVLHLEREKFCVSFLSATIRTEASTGHG